MELKPVKKYAVPSYPTRDYLNEHPELLRHIPERWRGNRVVLTAFAAAVMLMASVSSQAKGHSANKAHSRVAPIFDYGQAQLHYAGAGVMPPFMSEEEAAKIINDEVKPFGLHFFPPNEVPSAETAMVLTNDELIPRTAREPRGNPGDWHSLKDSTEYLDGYDVEHRIGYDFLSWKDYGRWGTYYSDGISGHEDYLEAAGRLRESLVAVSPKSAVGVFYSPVQSSGGADELLRDSEAQASWECYKEDHARPMEAERAKHYEDFLKREWSAQYRLRLQVRGFIAWLKTEGII